MKGRGRWASVAAWLAVFDSARGCSTDPGSEQGAPASVGSESAGTGAETAAVGGGEVDPDDRRQELDFGEAQALDKAGSSCPEKAAALRAYREKTGKERKEVDARLERKRAAGHPEPPMTKEQSTRFAFVKKTLLDVLGRCLDDPAFSAAFSNEPEPAPAGEWVLYRDPKGRFEARFPAAPETVEREGPSSLTEAVSLILGQGFYSASWMTLRNPARYDCDTVFDATLTRQKDLQCDIDEKKPLKVAGFQAVEVRFHCADGASGWKRAVCDPRPKEHFVNLFECQGIGMPMQADKTSGSRFLESCKLLSSEPARAPH